MDRIHIVRKQAVRGAPRAHVSTIHRAFLRENSASLDGYPSHAVYIPVVFAGALGVPDQRQFRKRRRGVPCQAAHRAGEAAEDVRGERDADRTVDCGENKRVRFPAAREVAILNLESALYFGLNEVGSFNWQAVEGPDVRRR
jgi:hypothetical protein